MTDVEPEVLEDPERIFIGRTLRQAREVEALLIAAGVDYVVHVEPVGRSFLFGTIRHGAVFSVTAARAALCRERLIDAGLAKGVVEGDPAETGHTREDERIIATIYKILPSRLWTAAIESGSLTGSPVDVADGFIHFSTAEQVRETAAKHFNGVSDLVLVAVPVRSLGDALKWEPSRGGDLFPHLYSPLAAELALWVQPLPVGPDGRHRFPEL